VPFQTLLGLTDKSSTEGVDSPTRADQTTKKNWSKQQLAAHAQSEGMTDQLPVWNTIKQRISSQLESPFSKNDKTVYEMEKPKRHNPFVTHTNLLQVAQRFANNSKRKSPQSYHS
jgi:hypothetical protein